MKRTLESVAFVAALLASGAALADAAATHTMPALAPLPAGTQPLDPHAGTTAFEFIFAGDNRPASASCSQPPQLTDLVNDIKGSKASFVLWGGDIIYGKDTAKAAGEYPEFLTLVGGAGVPIVAVPGNHEMSLKGTVECPVPGKNKEKKIDEPDRSGKLAAAYKAAVGAPYGVFRYGNAAFVGLDTDDALDADYDPGECGYNGYVGKAQVDALEGTLDALDADKSVAHVFVFMHRPLHGKKPKDELGPAGVKQIDRLRALLEPEKGKKWKYPKLSFVLASHEHLFYAHDAADSNKEGDKFSRKDPSDKGPGFLVSGGAGAPLSKDGHFNYLKFKIDGDAVTAKYEPIDDTTSNCPSS